MKIIILKIDDRVHVLFTHFYLSKDLFLYFHMLMRSTKPACVWLITEKVVHSVPLALILHKLYFI